MSFNLVPRSGDCHFRVRYGMHQSPTSDAVKNGRAFPAPPRVHWAVLLVLIAAAEALVCWLFPEPYRNFAIFVIAAAWPTYLCIWIRRVNPRASSLYWALASLVTGCGFLFSWLLWIVVIFELREELLEHYNAANPSDCASTGSSRFLVPLSISSSP